MEVAERMFFRLFFFFFFFLSSADKSSNMEFVGSSRKNGLKFIGETTRLSLPLYKILMEHIDQQSTHGYDTQVQQKWCQPLSTLSTRKQSRAYLPTIFIIFAIFLTVIGCSISLILCKIGTVNNIFINTFNGYDLNMILTVMYQQWYFVGITHVASRPATLRILRPSHVNDERVSSVDLAYPSINEPPCYCSGIFIVFFVCFVLFLVVLQMCETKKKKKATLSLHNSAVFCLCIISFVCRCYTCTTWDVYS